MRRMPFIYFALVALLLSMGVKAQLSTGRNFISKTDVIVPGVTTQAQVDALTIGSRLQNVSYFDGLGRSLQSVSVQMSPKGKDVVTPVEYDPFGRQVKQFLPYADGGTTYGSLRTTVYADQAAFYNPTTSAVPNIALDSCPYIQSFQEFSPLSRVMEQGTLGKTWQPGSGHAARAVWSSNVLSDSVHKWTIGASAGSLPVTSSIYAAGELTALTTTDEAGHKVVEFRDKENKPILKKVQLLNSGLLAHYGWLCTYYIYDDFNLLRFVLQPRAVELINNGSNTWTVTQPIGDELAFRYEYDQRHRMIIRKVPGAGEVWMVYDVRDRQVMTQDANLRTQTPSKWMVTVYDALNRPSFAGLLTDANNRTYHQNLAYNSASYPNTASNFELLSQNYYDDYSWASGTPAFGLSTGSQAKLITTYNTAPDYAVQPVAYMSTRGVTTGVMEKVLGTAYTYLYTLKFYDDHGREVQEQRSNYSGRVDTLTTQYNFSGQPLRVLLNHQKGGNAPEHHDVLTKLSYDPTQRVKNVFKNIDGLGDQLIDSLQYNELGQVRAKFLGNSLDYLAYDYNIRGWVTGINKNYVGGGTGNYFGLELGYDNPASVTGSNYVPQYNGNIAGLIWKTRGDSTKRKYDFAYDNVNRLTAANFLQNTGSGGWSNSFVDYTVNNIGYDANGNILSMNQKGFKWNGSSLIDQLTYTYLNSNKVTQVGDVTNDALSKLGDFHYSGTKSGPDYYYDGNGNLTSDRNKSIDTMVYNFLNLPQRVHITGKGDVLYTYGTSGNKFKKVTMDSLSRHATTTLYIAGFVYQHTDTITNPTAGVDTLQFLMHEEGRTRWARHTYTNGATKYGWEYDFFEKDHLGNTRVMLTQQKDTALYAATMEAAYRANENALFYNIPQTAYSRTLAGYPVDVSMTNPNDSVIMLNGTAGRTQGPAIILKVMAGDTIDIGAKSFYTSLSGTGTNPSITDVLAALAGGVVGITGGAKGAVGELNTTSSPLYGALNSFITNKDGTVAGKPRAYLNWMLMDNQYQYDAVKSGASAVGNTTAGTLSTLGQTGIVAAKSGFLYVWVSNETQGWPVYFDNLSVQVRSGAMLEETHYYPFGLTMAGISDKALKNIAENKYRYGGKELQNKEFADGSGLEEYDFGARMLDPQLGIWRSIDPLADKNRKWSPYVYGNDNPIRNIDPDGMESHGNDAGRQLAKPGMEDIKEDHQRQADGLASGGRNGNSDFIGPTVNKADGENGNGGDKNSDGEGRRGRRPDNKNKVDRKTRETRNWRERNIRRFIDGSFFDERGKEIFGMWLNGSGETANLSGDNWTKYMSSNDLLTEQVLAILKIDASQRAESGFLYVTTHAEIENGYFSGYEMLHGTDKRKGDFQIWGDAIYSESQVTYNLTLRWNDTIDPNSKYEGDVFSSAVFHTLFNPKDYDIHITWNEKYVIKLITK